MIAPCNPRPRTLRPPRFFPRLQHPLGALTGTLLPTGPFGPRGRDAGPPPSTPSRPRAWTQTVDEGQSDVGSGPSRSRSLGGPRTGRQSGADPSVTTSLCTVTDYQIMCGRWRVGRPPARDRGPGSTRDGRPAAPPTSPSPVQVCTSACSVCVCVMYVRLCVCFRP